MGLWRKGVLSNLRRWRPFCGVLMLDVVVGVLQLAYIWGSVDEPSPYLRNGLVIMIDFAGI